MNRNCITKRRNPLDITKSNFHPFSPYFIWFSICFHSSLALYQLIRSQKVPHLFPILIMRLFSDFDIFHSHLFHRVEWWCKNMENSKSVKYEVLGGLSWKICGRNLNEFLMQRWKRVGIKIHIVVGQFW